MNYQNLKFAQTSILLAVSIYAQSPIVYIITIGLAIFNTDRYYINIVLSCICSLVPFWFQLQSYQILYLLPFISMALLCYAQKKNIWKAGLSYQQKMTIFLMFLGLTTLNGKHISSYVQLFLFFLMLTIKTLIPSRLNKYVILGIKIILSIEALVLGLIIWSVVNWQIELNNTSWWFLASFPLAVLYLSFPIDEEVQKLYSQSLLTQSDKSMEIQLKDLSKRNSIDLQLQEKKEEFEQQLSGVNQLSQKDTNKFEEQQSQSLNLFLVIPFCLLQQGWLEIPIYIYILSLEWGISKRWLLSIVLLSAGIMSAKCIVRIEVDIALRIIAVLLVTKNLQGGYQIGEILKIIWLRSSFVLVLSVLFWFALLTVNIFHLLFIAIILLFITKGAGKSQTRSFRHQNWKYLLALFNIFIVMRLLYTFVQNLDSQRWREVLQLSGVSFSYLQPASLFNLVPLLINAIIGLQYFTYNSKIYSQQLQSMIFKNYKQIIASIIDSLTVIYYKLLPWVSYFAIISLLVILQPSFSAFVLLGCILSTLGVHVLSRNEPKTYRLLFWLWLFYSRLTSLQIVLRYAFQFAKFDLFSFMKQHSFFRFLLQYQQILGLAIRDQETVYFKTITKFQLMISVDLMAIFIAFLVTEYYSLLLKFSELPPKEEWSEQQHKVNEVYHSYIDFKLTIWLQGKKIYKILHIFCKCFFELYFPVLGLLCCAYISILSFMYLLIVLKYFSNLNFQFYRSHIQSGYGLKVLNIVLSWSKPNYSSETQELQSGLRNIGQQMQKQKIAQHKRLRIFFVIVTVIAVLLTYFSRTLKNIEIMQVFGQYTTLSLRWWLLIGGCSLQSGFMGHFSKIMLLFLVIQMKCCWFINKYQLTARKYPPEQEEQTIIREVLTKQEEQIHDQQNMPNALEVNSIQDIQSSVLGQRIEEQKEISEMRVSLLLGSLKLLQRSFVMVLVFISIVLGSHPFGIVYLLCAILLNYLGSISIKVLSRILYILMVVQYLLILSNYSNRILFPQLTPTFGRFQQRTILHSLFDLPEQWEWYLTFGKGAKELSMLSISWILLVCYQLYFLALKKAWMKVLTLVDEQVKLSTISKQLIQHFRQIYEYGLTYSPLVIMLLCLFIYLLDYTVTNMLLSSLTVGFIFVSFLVRDYRQSRHFWRTYFVFLQLLIVCFMLIYSLLQLPMLSDYCNRYLCAPQELHTQIYKAVLLLILQIGLDLTSSYHFDRALRQFEHSKGRIDHLKLAIAYHQNDKKIYEKFKQITKERQLSVTIKDVQHFLKEIKENPQLEFEDKSKSYQTKQSWYSIIIEFLPSLIDKCLLLSDQQSKERIIKQNVAWIQLKKIDEINPNAICELYMDDYGQLQGQQLQKELKSTLYNIQCQNESDFPLIHKEKLIPPVQHKQQDHQQDSYRSRKSYVAEQFPLETHQLVEQMRKTAKNEEQQQQLIYLLLVESILSNWHYLTYFFLVLLHIENQGLLTLPIPAVVFFFGVVSSYQAGKQVWRSLILLILVPLMFKFIINMKIMEPSEDLIYLLIGDSKDSVILQYICIVSIICQCVILKMIGHFSDSTEEIQCMKMALVRNILNNCHVDQKQDMFKLLAQSNKIPLSFGDLLFGKAECKPGYDYSTLLTTLQLMVLVWIFLFYDKMAVRQQITFYQMIEYNQFNSGMVALTLCQLLFLLTERFIAIVDLRSFSDRWEIGLLLKYILLVCNFLLVQIVVLIYFPLSSGQFEGNAYVTVLLVMNMLGLLVQSLQIKAGLDQSSRGFMDRYTWYNGFIYMGYRAIPFLFEFKAFSDWTFTRTSLRIFDWIRLQEIFGRLYVAKCNALFLSGKLLGSKIEWWKKLLMGYPLLLSIILLIFGPLVLFSSLNPLASRNDVIGGYLQVILRINKTNQYPLYTNSHITDIHRLNATQSQLQLLKLFDIDIQTVQQLHLQQFSDQYWQISQGSYYKLLAQPQDSFYQLIVRAKFDRNQTGVSSLYVLSSYQIQQQRVPQFKEALLGRSQFCAERFLPTFLRMDNNNGLHEIADQYETACLKCTAGVRASKQYWVLVGGLRLRMASDKYTKAIFGYSVMSFYISIILVIANYFKFLFQGTVNTIITSDIPYPDPALSICNSIFRARRQNDLQNEQILFWTLIDLLRSPDTLKALTGNYLQARLQTLKTLKNSDKMD